MKPFAPVPLFLSFLFIVSFLIPLESLSQHAPRLRWHRTFGYSFGEDARMIVLDGEGGYAVAGMTNTADSSAADLLCIHVDGMGIPIWEQIYDYGQITKAKDIYRIPGDGYLVTGYRLDNDGTGMDCLILRLNNQGELIWDHLVNGRNDDVAWATRPIEGGYIVLGITESNELDRKDAFLMKLDSEGNRVWEQLIGTDRADRATCLVLMPDGGYAFSGMTRDNPDGNDDGWLVRTDAEGNVLWMRNYGGPRIDEFYWMEPLPEGGFILCGRTQSSHEREDFDTWLVKTDEDGNVLGDWSYGTPAGNDWAEMVQVLPDGYVMTGLGYTREDRNQVSLIRVMKNGNVIFADQRGGPYSDKGYALRVLDDGAYIIAGKYTDPSNGDTNLLIARTRPDLNRVFGDYLEE
jgi:hypothetical protein